MKICLVSQEYPPETGWGGIGTQTYLKAHGLSRLGHQVHVVSSVTNGVARTYHDAGAVIHRVVSAVFGSPGYEESTYWLAYSASVAEKLTALDQDIHFDIIQFPEYAGEGFVYQTDTFRYRTARYVLQLHGPLAMFTEHVGWPEPGSTLHRLGCFMEGTVIHYADRVLASSYNTAAFSAGRYDYPMDQIQVIHSGVDTSLFFPRPQSRAEFHPRILFVGTLTDSKGLSILTEAVIRLRVRYPEICLRIIGKGDEGYMKDLRAMIATAGAVEAFEFVGYVPYQRLSEHYVWCDFLVAPSVYEPGPGNVYLEAMACGKPVIACNTGGAPEVVLDRETGLLVPRRDIEALGEAIVALTEDVELQEALGRNGREWVEERFSIEKYSRAVERVYSELVAG
jgi:glycosyltransferase involved in cell wall biosynthesis